MIDFDSAITKFTNGFRSFEIAAKMERSGFEAAKELRKDFCTEHPVFGGGDAIDQAILIYLAAAILVERAKSNLSEHILPEHSDMIQELAKKSVGELNKISEIRDYVTPHKGKKTFANGEPKPPLMMDKTLDGVAA